MTANLADRCQHLDPSSDFRARRHCPKPFKCISVAILAQAIWPQALALTLALAWCIETTDNGAMALARISRSSVGLSLCHAGKFCGTSADRGRAAFWNFGKPLTSSRWLPATSRQATHFTQLSATPVLQAGPVGRDEALGSIIEPSAVVKELCCYAVANRIHATEMYP